jgi:hypothetical protein
MRIISRLWAFLLVSIVLSSCQFECKVGDVGKKEKPVANKPVHTSDGATLYNGIQMNAHKVSVNKAYLIFENGERVPDDNFIELSSTEKLVIIINNGWTEDDGRVWLGASEKVVTENGNVLLEEKDLFAESTEGASATDAKIISLSVTLNLKKGTPPTVLIVYYKVWDKKGEGFVEGSYKLYTK